MNIERAKQEIINTIRIYTAKDANGFYRIPSLHQRPLLLIGPPGIGKTAIMRQAADACGVGLVSYTITHHTRQSAVGLPVVTKKVYGGREISVTEYTMSEIIASVYESIEHTGRKEGILFIDEINCVSETLAPTMLQFLQNKTFGTHSIPEGWIIVAAGNPPEYNKAARTFDIVTMDRVKYLPVDVDFPVWKAYAIEQGIHSAIISYLSAKPQHFYYIEETRGEREFVTARGWEDLSILLQSYEREGIEITAGILAEYLHCKSIALDFAAYYTMFTGFQKDYKIAEILAGTGTADALVHQTALLRAAGPDERYSVLQLILSHLFDRFSAYAAAIRCDSRKGEVCTLFRDLALKNNGMEADAVLKQYSDSFDQALRIKRDHHICAQDVLHVEEQVSSWLSACRYRLKEERIVDAVSAADALDRYLQTDLDAHNTLACDIDTMLERAFVFLETALSANDGMGYFMTALSLNKHAAAYLNSHHCAGYARNLSALEFTEAEEALKQQIRKVLV